MNRLEEAEQHMKQANDLLLAEFEERGGWDEKTGIEKRVVSNIQSARSHISRALSHLT